MRLLTFVLLVLLLCECSVNNSTSSLPKVARNPEFRPKPRTIVTTDGEVDDVDSFIRLLLYSNEMDLVGLIYSSSQWHYKGDGRGTKFTSQMPYTAKRYGERTELRWPGTDWMQEYINDYSKVLPNLKTHSADYPAPEKLLSLIKIGNIDFEGDIVSNTEGSNHIKYILLDKDTSKVYVQIWGGTNTLARALKSIEDEYAKSPEWKAIYQKVSDKTVIYAVLDQDATYKNYVSVHWPDIKVYYNSDQFWSFAYAWPLVVPKELQKYLDGKWFSKNIIFDHGPLMGKYFTWGDGRQIKGDPEHTHGQMTDVKKFNRQQYDFISEGDSPAYLFLLDVGLRSLENPSFGGWGGRLVQSTENKNRWEDGKHVTDFSPATNKDETTYPQVRWIDVIQNDFAARADWCVKSYDSANHAPIVSIEGEENIRARAGQNISIEGSASDPDHNDLVNVWWHYKEAGTYPKQLSLTNNDSPMFSFVIPNDAVAGQTIHLIYQVTDKGVPKLTRYKRAIVTIIQ